MKKIDKGELYMENINSLAKDWIYELLEERRKLIHKCINYRTSENNWKDMIELTIAEIAWEANYGTVRDIKSMGCYNNIEVLFDIDKCNNNLIGFNGETWIADFNLEKI